jgi:hypothetical protein
MRVLSNSPGNVNKARPNAGTSGRRRQAVQKVAAKVLMEQRPKLIKSLEVMWLRWCRWWWLGETVDSVEEGNKGGTSCRAFRHA